MRKKTLLFFTAICITLLSVVTPFNNVEASPSSSPKIGDVIHGFALSAIDYDAAIKADQYLFIHQKTGAKFAVLKNSDTNRGFSIKFDTVAENNKGINHILEHSVMSGSKKYPGVDVFFALDNATYTSFTNAFTYQNFTIYPICSANEAQLLKSADIYLDAVFNPILLEDERLFQREGIRYELTSETSDITYNGIVYNEMQGAMGDIERASYHNSMKTLFPDNSQGNNSGGNPEDITTLTYHELMETYNKYYHPSNSTMVLYGDVDYEPFLKMVDESYLSAYSYKEYNIDRGTQPKFTQLQENTYLFPASQDTDTENSAVIELVFATKGLEEMGFENYVALDTAIKLLNLDNADIKQAMLASNIADNYDIYFDDGIYPPVVHFIAINAHPEGKTDFYNLVMDELEKAVNNGFDKDFIHSSLRAIEFQQGIGTTSTTAENSLIYASIYDSVLGTSLFNYNETFKSVANKMDDTILEKVIKAQIVDNKSAALTVTIPQAGLLEKRQEEIATDLANKKASMTNEEIKALVTKTKDFSVWNNEEASEETIKSLQAVTLNELNIELKDRALTETTVDGVKLMYTNADVDSVSAVNLIFDLSHLTSEELLYLKFYNEMLESGMATDNRTESQIMNELLYKTYNSYSEVTAFMDDNNDTSAHPIFNVEYKGFQEEFTDSLDLMSDILLNSQVSDISAYSARTISNIKSTYQSLFADPIYLAFNRSRAYSSPSQKYLNYLNGLDYYYFVMDLEKQLQLNPTEVSKIIQGIRTKAFNKNNLTVLLAGNSSAADKLIASMPALTQKLPNESYPKAVYSLPTPAKREALTTNLTVQFSVVNAPLLPNDVPNSGQWDVFANILDNLILIPEVRLKGGAYGVGTFFTANSYNVYTYRDNTYASSLATIGTTHEFLKNLTANITQEALETYKLGAYATVTQSTGELESALNTLKNNCQGITTQDKINFLNEIKQTSLDDVLTYSNYLQKLNNDLNYIVIASPRDIEAHKDLFDKIIALP